MRVAGPSSRRGLTASLAGRGTCGLSAGAQIAPAATANEEAQIMKLAIVRWYPVLLLRNALGRFMALRVPVTSPRRHRGTRPTILPVQLTLF